MQMHAITKHYGLEDAIRLAILAGVDIMTFSNNISGSDERTVDKVHSIIRDMVARGVIPEARIDESFDRIMTLKKQLNPPDEVELLKKELEEARQKLQNAEEVIRDVNQKVAEPAPLVEEKSDKKRSRKKIKDL
jgi:beta-N-acetylhexosaminidase